MEKMAVFDIDDTLVYWDDGLAERPIPAGIEKLNELKSQGFVIAYCTAKPESERENALRVLTGLGLPDNSEMLFMIPETGMNVPRFKRDTIKRLMEKYDVQHFYDDKKINRTVVSNIGVPIVEAIPLGDDYEYQEYFSPGDDEVFRRNPSQGLKEAIYDSIDSLINEIDNGDYERIWSAYDTYSDMLYSPMPFERVWPRYGRKGKYGKPIKKIEQNDIDEAKKTLIDLKKIYPDHLDKINNTEKDGTITIYRSRLKINEINIEYSGELAQFSGTTEAHGATYRSDKYQKMIETQKDGEWFDDNDLKEIATVSIASMHDDEVASPERSWTLNKEFAEDFSHTYWKQVLHDNFDYDKYVEIASERVELSRIDWALTALMHYGKEDEVFWSMPKKNPSKKGWKITKKYGERIFEFGDFEQVADFISELNKAIIDVDHHPEIEFDYNKVKVKTWSHDTNSFTDRDEKLIKAINKIKVKGLVSNPAPGYQSYAWTTQDWRSIKVNNKGGVDYSEQCGGKGTRTKTNKPRLCLPIKVIKKLMRTDVGKKVLFTQARKKARAKKGEKVSWHPMIKKLHNKLEKETVKDIPQRNPKPISVRIEESSNPEKKMMATFEYKDGDTKTTHFGARGMSDYTQHKDEKRMKRYLKRHGEVSKTKSSKENWDDPTTAGALSRWILWGKPSLRESFNDFKKRFNLKGTMTVTNTAEIRRNARSAKVRHEKINWYDGLKSALEDTIKSKTRDGWKEWWKMSPPGFPNVAVLFRSYDEEQFTIRYSGYSDETMGTSERDKIWMVAFTDKIGFDDTSWDMVVKGLPNVRSVETPKRAFGSISGEYVVIGQGGFSRQDFIDGLREMDLCTEMDYNDPKNWARRNARAMKVMHKHKGWWEQFDWRKGDWDGNDSQELLSNIEIGGVDFTVRWRSPIGSLLMEWGTDSDDSAHELIETRYQRDFLKEATQGFVDNWNQRYLEWPLETWIIDVDRSKYGARRRFLLRILPAKRPTRKERERKGLSLEEVNKTNLWNLPPCIEAFNMIYAATPGDIHETPEWFFSGRRNPERRNARAMKVRHKVNWWEEVEWFPTHKRNIPGTIRSAGKEHLYPRSRRFDDRGGKQNCDICGKPANPYISNMETPIGSRSFCTEKEYTEYVGLEYKGEGYYTKANRISYDMIGYIETNKGYRPSMIVIESPIYRPKVKMLVDDDSLNWAQHNGFTILSNARGIVYELKEPPMSMINYIRELVPKNHDELGFVDPPDLERNARALKVRHQQNPWWHDYKWKIKHVNESAHNDSYKPDTIIGTAYDQGLDIFIKVKIRLPNYKADVAAWGGEAVRVDFHRKQPNFTLVNEKERVAWLEEKGAQHGSTMDADQYGNTNWRWKLKNRGISHRSEPHPEIEKIGNHIRSLAGLAPSDFTGRQLKRNARGIKVRHKGTEYWDSAVNPETMEEGSVHVEESNGSVHFLIDIEDDSNPWHGIKGGRAYWVRFEPEFAAMHELFGGDATDDNNIMIITAAYMDKEGVWRIIDDRNWNQVGRKVTGKEWVELQEKWHESNDPLKNDLASEMKKTIDNRTNNAYNFQLWRKWQVFNTRKQIEGRLKRMVELELNPTTRNPNLKEALETLDNKKDWPPDVDWTGEEEEDVWEVDWNPALKVLKVVADLGLDKYINMPHDKAIAAIEKKFKDDPSKKAKAIKALNKMNKGMRKVQDKGWDLLRASPVRNNPIREKKDEQGNYFQYGKQKKYYFDEKSTESRQAAYDRVKAQVAAIFASGYRPR